MPINLYYVLGVGETANKEQIKKAYREKAKKHHPDKKGGDAEKMALLSLAYETLIDDAKRAHWDRTGETRCVKTTLEQLIARKFHDLLNSGIDIDRIDIINTIKKTSNIVIAKAENSIKNAEATIEKKRKSLSRIKCHNEAQNNLFDSSLNALINMIQHDIEKMKKEVAQEKAMIEILDNYKDTKIIIPERGTSTSFNVGTIRDVWRIG